MCKYCKSENPEPIFETLKDSVSVVKSGKRGICSEERSLISPEYARNFICDFILGKKQEIGQLSLF